MGGGYDIYTNENLDYLIVGGAEKHERNFGGGGEYPDFPGPGRRGAFERTGYRLG